MFRLNDIANKQNVRVCGVQRPDEHISMVMNSPGVIMYRAI